MMDKKSVKKIGVIMFGLFGDVLMRTPLLKALKEIFPEAQLVAICDANMTPLLVNNPNIEKIIAFQRTAKNPIKKNYYKLQGIYKVKKERFHLLVDLYNGGSSPLISLLSGAKYRLGYAHQKDSHVYNLQSDFVPYSQNKLEPFNYQLLELLRPISDKKFPMKPIFQLSKEIESSMQSYLDEVLVKQCYVLNLGSNGSEKLLAYEKYAAVVKYLYEVYGFTPLIVRNPSQEYFQEELIQKHLLSQNLPFVKLKTLSIDEIAYVIKAGSFLITPDTGLMHLGLALDSYLYAIFTYTNPSLVDIGDEKFVAVYESFSPKELYRKQEISTEILLQKVDELLQRVNNAK